MDLKGNLKGKWQLIKAQMNHEDAFLDIHSALTGGSQGEDPQAELAPPGEAAGAPQPQEQVAPEGDVPMEEQAPEQEMQEAPSEEQMEAQPEEAAPEEAEQAGEEDQGSLEEQEAELVQALKDLGHTDSEIAHIVHGHSLSHAVEHLKEKVQEDFKALKEHQNLDHQGKMSEIELAHKKRMLEMEAQSQDPGHEGRMRDLDLEHKKRMLDLEHKHAERMKDLEFETKKKKATEAKND